VSALLERLTGLTLRDPWLLALAVLLPVVLLVRLRTRQRRPTVTLSSAGLLGHVHSPRTDLLHLPRVLQVLGLVLLLVALARPTERVRLADETTGIDILLCVDTSSSMLSKDMDAERTRLTVAKDAATAFIERRPDDRIGLITFARYPDLSCPLTLDHMALAAILAQVETVKGEGPEDATGIGAAVARAAQVMRAGGGRSRVVILLTDGEENVAVGDARSEIPPRHAAQLCEKLGVRVYAIAAGVGRRGPDGTLVRIDTQPVEDMALRTGGFLGRARNAAAVRQVYERIDALETAPIEQARFVLRDRYLWFLLLGLALLLVGRVLADTWLEVQP
jgi:Ca-activated chloride channel family protein